MTYRRVLGAGEVPRKTARRLHSVASDSCRDELERETDQFADPTTAWDARGDLRSPLAPALVLVLVTFPSDSGGFGGGTP